jgi:chromosome segregation ATPase
MAGNPFEDASELVGGLREEYTKLNEDLPPLRKAVAEAKDKLLETNKAIAKAETRLDSLKTEIDERTATYNDWQRAELAQLEQKRKEVKREQSDIETDLAERLSKLEDRETAVDARVRAVKTAEARRASDQMDIDAQTQKNLDWSERLKADEERLDSQATAQEKTGVELNDRAATLDLRDKNITKGEQLLKDTIESAERDRKAAKKLREDAKISIAINDAREQELKIYANSLKKKEEKLRVDQAALNDRRNIMISNGS